MNVTRQLIMIYMICVLILFSHENLNAEIYKYQDENGKWYFTDKPRDGDVVKKSKKNDSTKDSTDLDISENFSEKTEFNSPLEKATYSVVTVETRTGKGSGFFISKDCYLITNKHVVRPTTTTNWKKNEEEIDQKKDAIKNEKQYLSKEKKRLEINKRKLADFREYVDSLRPSGHKNDEEAEYKYRLQNYEDDMDELKERSKLLKEQEKVFRKLRSEFSIESSLANISSNFKIILKNDNELTAKLIQLSKDEDLALLKVDNCKSPYLELSRSIKPYQGMKIYAVGSPLGLKDHITAGIVTNTRDSEINIDAQILPGNSGGPLITEQAEVIGVNTFKVSRESANSEGFGIAIPTEKIYQEFSKYLN
ncbi:MAG: trypsin-like peptidase domain-containing protein [Pseudomonadota bacterium]